MIEIENKKCHICYNINTPIKLVPDKLIMSPYGLNIPNSPRKIDNPNYTSFSKKSIKLDNIFQSDFKKTLIEDVICEHCSLFSLEIKEAKFTVWGNLEEHT